jgi:homoserine O-acetyltransferase/O-succinyltransferase
MGGMNTWMWGYLYPDVAKALMPVACLPQKLAGQNLLFRRLMLAMIEACAERQDNDTNSSSLGVGFAWNVFQLMVSSPAKLEHELTTPEAADRYITEARKRDKRIHPLMFFGSSALLSTTNLLINFSGYLHHC